MRAQSELPLQIDLEILHWGVEALGLLKTIMVFLRYLHTPVYQTPYSIKSIPQSDLWLVYCKIEYLKYGNIYMQGYVDKMLDSLNRRMQSPEAQTSEDVAQVLWTAAQFMLPRILRYNYENWHFQVVLNLVELKLEAKSYQAIPFNIGSSKESQAVVAAVRKNPTGTAKQKWEILHIYDLPPLSLPYIWYYCLHVAIFTVGWGGIYSMLAETVPKFPPNVGHNSEL